MRRTPPSAPTPVLAVALVATAAVVYAVSALSDAGRALDRAIIASQLEDGPVGARAEVVRQQTVNARWALSLRFLDLPEKEQDRVRRRVFQAMREERARHSD